MVKRIRQILSGLYLQDETAWLEEMSRLAAEGRLEEMDFPNLSEYLADMASRDRREVLCRLRVLIAHRLKWDHRPKRRSRSWRQTIIDQRQDLGGVLESRTLLNHAREVFAKAYLQAVKQAAAATGLAEDAFPKACPYSIEQLLADD